MNAPLMWQVAEATHQQCSSPVQLGGVPRQIHDFDVILSQQLTSGSNDRQ